MAMRTFQTGVRRCHQSRNIRRGNLCLIVGKIGISFIITLIIFALSYTAPLLSKTNYKTIIKIKIKTPIYNLSITRGNSITQGRMWEGGEEKKKTGLDKKRRKKGYRPRGRLNKFE